MTRAMRSRRNIDRPYPRPREGTVYSVVAIKSALERPPARDTESSVNKLPRILVIGALSGPGAQGGTAGFPILQPRFGARTAAPAGSCAASLSVRLNPLWQRRPNRGEERTGQTRRELCCVSPRRCRPSKRGFFFFLFALFASDPVPWLPA